jgi:hypothetical protein
MLCSKGNNNKVKKKTTVEWEKMFTDDSSNKINIQKIEEILKIQQ